MKQETKRLTSIIIAALIIAGALVVYFEFIIPAYTSVELVKGQEESELTLYANETQIASKVKSLLATYQSDAATSQSVNDALPVGPDVSGALAQIYGIAANSNLSVQGTGISVQAVQAVTPTAQAGATGSQLTNAAAAGSIVKPTGIVSFQITSSGSYEALKNFLQGLSTNIRLFEVTALAVQPAGIAATKTQAGNQDLFSYTITAVTHYQAP